ncbi:MAG TPA: 2-dehydropantoate 2-reductase [Gammaproteobacteria bacterium]|nr:2-dehydropantoate 2-reductase [Gammaproteobacteria bacterium]
MSKFDFAVLGAGAMGSILAAHLARAGHSVALLARGRRAAQVRGGGLRITGLVSHTVPVPVIDDPAQLREADVLIVATKAIGTAESLRPLAGAKVGCAFSVQNGVLKNELLQAAFGREHVLGALANLSGELQPSGEVLFTRNVSLQIGSLAGGVPDAVRDLARTIDAAGVRAVAVPDVAAREWSKFVAWVGMAGVAITTRVATWKYLMDPDAALLLVKVIREMRELAARAGVTLTDESVFPVATLASVADEEAVRILNAIGAQMREHAPSHRLSAHQDIDAGRPLEVEETLGHAARSAQREGLSLPLVDAVYRIAAAIDRTSRAPNFG